MYAAELIYFCDDCDRYHLAFFDYNEEGQLMRGDTDGDWEACDEEDMPSVEEMEAGSRGYLEQVAEGGVDYLGQLFVTSKRKATWQVRFRNWVGSTTHGIMFDGARRRSRGEWIYDPNELPEYLRQYLMIEDLGHLTNLVCCPEFKSIKELREAASDVTFQPEKYPDLLARFVVTLDEPLPEVTVNRLTKQAAKRALKRMESNG